MTQTICSFFLSQGLKKIVLDIPCLIAAYVVLWTILKYDKCIIFFIFNLFALSDLHVLDIFLLHFYVLTIISMVLVFDMFDMICSLYILSVFSLFSLPLVLYGGGNKPAWAFLSFYTDALMLPCYGGR